MNEIALGRAEQFRSFPAPVTAEQHDYFLLKQDDAYVLVSRRCPHMGYPVEAEADQLVCHLHGWTFDSRTGACLELPNECLRAYPVVVRDGVLTVSL